MKFEDFTKEERFVIAEFVYSYDSDILIKSDAISLVDLFIDKYFVDSQQALKLKDNINNNIPVLEEMIEILFTCVEEKEGQNIMNEYFGRSLI
jgi:hypothetical protein